MTQYKKDQIKSFAETVYADNIIFNNGDTEPLFTGLIDINTAKKEEFITLPKIGPVTAERIILFRDDFGSFSTKDDLNNIKGIGENPCLKLPL